MGSTAIIEPIKVFVPDGFFPQSMPCDSKTRLDDSDIKIEQATEADMPAIAYGVLVCFPEIWWNSHRPASGEPSPDWRLKCLTERLSPMVKLPGFYAMKATVDGEFAGFAGWHSPERKGFFTNLFNMNAVKDLELDKMMGWSQSDLDEMWSDVSHESWNKEFEGYCALRQKILGELPHWFLAPLFVLEKFRGRGVGSKLLRWANERADLTSPKTPLYLETLPNARPVYLHLGYESQEGQERSHVMIRNDPRKWIK